MKKEKIKLLKINNAVYAKYLIEGNVLYLKMIKKILPDDAGASENYLITTISLIEKKQFSLSAHLNIK